MMLEISNNTCIKLVFTQSDRTSEYQQSVKFVSPYAVHKYGYVESLMKDIGKGNGEDVQSSISDPIGEEMRKYGMGYGAGGGFADGSNNG